MNWALWMIFGTAAAVLIGSAAVAGSSSAFWYGFGKLLLADLWPVLKALVAADFTPEHAAKVAEQARTGQPMESRHGPRHKGDR